MYLKKTYRKDSGRTYLVIAQKYRNPKTNVSTDRTIKSLGYLDELEKLYDDPVTHFKEVARKMTEEEKAKKKLTLSINMDEELEPGSDEQEKLRLRGHLKNLPRAWTCTAFSTTRPEMRILSLIPIRLCFCLVISRFCRLALRSKAFEEKDRYFERFNFSVTDMYRALSHFGKDR
jgi:hypothetical protein